MFGVSEGRALAGSAARNQKIDPGFDLPPDKPAKVLFIERLVAPEGGHQRRAASSKHVPPPKERSAVSVQRSATEFRLKAES
jgi:hypothetical protein